MSRPTDLTDELTLQIRAMVLDGLKYNKIQEILAIPANTWDAWVYKNYKDFRANLIDWKKERLLKKSEKLSEEILDTLHLDEKGGVSTEILRIKQKESEFIRQTLGKQEYSSRQEITGKDGQAIVVMPSELIHKNATDESTESNS